MLRHHEGGQSKDYVPYFPDEYFPLAPEPVRDAYTYYWQTTDTSRESIADQEREMALVNTYISDFCDEYIKPPVYTAAMLGPIADKLDDAKNAENAWQALQQYASSPDEDPTDAEYVLGVLADRPLVTTFWQSAVKNHYAGTPELRDLLQLQTPEQVTDEAMWEAPAQLVSPDAMLGLLDNVNLESLLIRSAETLAFFDSPKAGQDSLTLRRIHQAESLLAPLCEIIGFDGLAMALYSKTNILRAQYGGKTDAIIRAHAAIAERGNEHQVDADVQSLFSVIFGSHIHEQVIKHGAPHGIVIGEGFCTNDNIRVVWRLKSTGSLARKIIRENHPEQLPMDILGATLVTRDEQQLAEQLGHIIDRTHDDGRVRLQPTPERTDAVHVKGTPDYIETVRQALGFDSIESMRRFVDVVEVAPGGHRVCKVTLIYRHDGRPDLHAEIQLTTEKDRVEARIGSAAHLLYKFAGTSEKAIDPSHLADIRARKSNLQRVGLAATSKQRATDLYQRATNAPELTA